MLKKIKRTVTDLVPIGLYLVSFDLIYGNYCNEGDHECCMKHGCMDNGREYLAEIDPVLTKVTKSNYLTLTEDVVNRDNTWNANHSFEGDTHDLRPRLFKSLHSAERHIKYTTERFSKPQVWERFVKTA